MEAAVAAASLDVEYDYFRMMHSSPLSTEVCLEILRKSLEYWIVKKGVKKLNVLDLGTCDGYTIYSLWNKAIRNFKSLEKIHIYVSNIVHKQFDETLQQVSKSRTDLDRRIVIHPISSSTNFRDYRSSHFKDFKMNIITCWLDTRVSWADPHTAQSFFSILSTCDFIRPGGLFLYMHFDGPRLLSKLSYDEHPESVYGWIYNHCLVVSKLCYQNMCCAYIRHPWDLLVYMYLDTKHDVESKPLVISTFSFHTGLVESLAQKFGFQPVFRKNIAHFVRNHWQRKQSPISQDKWWLDAENWEFAKMFLVGVYCFDPEEDVHSFDASQVFYN